MLRSLLAFALMSACTPAKQKTVLGCFSAATVSSASLGGPLVSAGTACPGGDASSSYYDQTQTCTGCCTASATSGTAENHVYFFDTTNAPMKNWDLVNVWQANAGVYPTLR